MITPVASGFVSFYRSSKKYEAIYLHTIAPECFLGTSMVNGQMVFEFEANEEIKRGVEAFAKNPDKAMVPVTKFEEAAESLGLASSSNGSVAGRRGAGPPRGKRNRITDEALIEMGQLLRKDTPKQAIIAVLGDKYDLRNIADAVYYNWKKKALAMT